MNTLEPLNINKKKSTPTQASHLNSIDRLQFPWLPTSIAA